MSDTRIWWLRRDLRLADNPALVAAAGAGRLLAVYIHAPDEEAPWAPGAASRWWLHHSLSALDGDLARRGNRLVIAQGPSLDTLRQLIAATGARAVHWNRRYEPAVIARDTAVKQALRADDISCTSHNGALWCEPWELKTGGGEPYRVFTPFWRQLLARLNEVPQPLAIPALPPAPDNLPTLPLDALDLLPRIPWDAGLAATWQPGEAGAGVRLAAFLDGAVADYAGARHLPGRPGTSRLSPHLHFGEIAPRQVLAALRGAGYPPGVGDAFLRELGWREFNTQLLYHFPHTPEAPLDARFAALDWRPDPDGRLLGAWQRGVTGIPIVDAGMRELWHTGWMHNRVRMLVASLLTKNLRLPWQAGARWFWDTLVDADLANNTAGWQWTAGCGADAAPYFRIFNPVLQGQRFDPEGVYVRRWCPALARLPAAAIHAPWEQSPALLKAAGITLGQDYPRPMLDLKTTRDEALARWEAIKGGAGAG